MEMYRLLVETTEDYVFPECSECVSECRRWEIQWHLHYLICARCMGRDQDENISTTNRRSQFDTYNSYGNGFADDAISALMGENPEWTKDRIKCRCWINESPQGNFSSNNFLSVNIYFRDMAYTSYVQVQAATVTDTLSKSDDMNPQQYCSKYR